MSNVARRLRAPPASRSTSRRRRLASHLLLGLREARRARKMSPVAVPDQPVRPVAAASRAAHTRTRATCERCQAGIVACCRRTTAPHRLTPRPFGAQLARTTSAVAPRSATRPRLYTVTVSGTLSAAATCSRGRPPPRPQRRSRARSRRAFDTRSRVRRVAPRRDRRRHCGRTQRDPARARGSRDDAPYACSSVIARDSAGTAATGRARYGAACAAAIALLKRIDERERRLAMRQAS